MIIDLKRSVDLRWLFDHWCYLPHQMILFNCSCQFKINQDSKQTLHPLAGILGLSPKKPVFGPKKPNFQQKFTFWVLIVRRGGWGVGVNNLGLPLHTIFCTLLNGFRNGLTGHLTRWMKSQFTQINLTLKEVKSIQLPKSSFPSILRFFGICGPHTPFSNLGC